MDSETYVEDRKLDHVRLVCSSAHCTATKLDINGKKHLVHKTICMEPYQFKSSLRQWFMNPEFAESEVMNEEGKCKVGDFEKNVFYCRVYSLGHKFKFSVINTRKVYLKMQ